MPLTELRWQSSTTGGVAGVIIDLEKPGTGEFAITTAQKNTVVPLDGMGLRGKSFQVGGVGKKLSVYRLPTEVSSRILEFRIRPKAKDLHPGDNPLYICAVQIDGHMAWSNPVYLVLRG